MGQGLLHGPLVPPRGSLGERRAEQGKPTGSLLPGTDTDRAKGNGQQSGQGGDKPAPALGDR